MSQRKTDWKFNYVLPQVTLLYHENKTQSRLIFFYRAPEHKTYQEMRNTVRAESNYKF